MSETDSFISEVSAEVRRDRLFVLMRRYGWIALLAVVLIVGGAAVIEYRKAQARAAAEAFGDSLSAALQTEDPAARAAALGAIGATGDRAVVDAFLASSAAVEAGDIPAALERLDGVVAQAELAKGYRHLALLKRVILAGADMDPIARDTALAELATPGAPYRVLAMEQQALVMVAGGDRAAALMALEAVLQEPDLTPGLRQRATQLIVALGGDGSSS